MNALGDLFLSAPYILDEYIVQILLILIGVCIYAILKLKEDKHGEAKRDKPR